MPFTTEPNDAQPEVRAADTLVRRSLEFVGEFRGRELSHNDFAHYQKIVLALS